MTLTCILQNFNSLSIIVTVPIVNYGLYPLLRKLNVYYGPVARISTGLMMSAVGGAGYTILNYYAYKQSPCGNYGSSDCTVGTGVAPITVWWMAIPYGLGGISEIFVNVPAYGIAYSRAPANMRGLVSAINLLNTGFAYAIGLACTSIITDPYLTWDFGGPAIVGAVVAVLFYILFRHIDKEEYTLNDSAENTDIHHTLEGTNVNEYRSNSINATTNEASAIEKNEAMLMSPKQ